jgi:tRNA (guanine-N7-)-methyltransferase
MKKEASLTFVTDDPVYHEKTSSLFLKSPLFASCLPPPFYVTEMAGYGTSFFENLWRDKGKSIYYQQWKKSCPSL